MNVWKISFWACLAILIFVTLSLGYYIKRQSDVISQEHESGEIRWTKYDMLVRIINNTDLSKDEVISYLSKNDYPFSHREYGNKDENRCAIELLSIMLIFKNDKLVEVQEVAAE